LHRSMYSLPRPLWNDGGEVLPLPPPFIVRPCPPFGSRDRRIDLVRREREDALGHVVLQPFEPLFFLGRTIGLPAERDELIPHDALGGMDGRDRPPITELLDGDVQRRDAARPGQ